METKWLVCDHSNESCYVILSCDNILHSVFFSLSKTRRFQHPKKLISQLVGLFKRLKLCSECFANDFILQNESPCRDQTQEKTETLRSNKNWEEYSNCKSFISRLDCSTILTWPRDLDSCFRKRGKTIKHNITFMNDRARNWQPVEKQLTTQIRWPRLQHDTWLIWPSVESDDSTLGNSTF